MQQEGGTPDLAQRDGSPAQSSSHSLGSGYCSGGNDGGQPAMRRGQHPRQRGVQHCWLPAHSIFPFQSSGLTPTLCDYSFYSVVVVVVACKISAQHC